MQVLSSAQKVFELKILLLHCQTNLSEIADETNRGS